MTHIDQATDIRDGEALDLAAVDRFMKRAVPGLKGQPTLRQYPGGASNLTYQVDYGERSFVLRRPPFGQIARSAHDMLREARVMQALKPVYPYVPTIVATCDDPAVLGCDFYVMERLEGIILRQDFPEGFNLDEAGTRTLCLNVINKLVDLHTVDARARRPGHPGQGARLRAAPDPWLERPLPSCPYRGCGRFRRGDGLAGGQNARGQGPSDHPQRLPFRQRGAESGQPA